MPPTNPDPSRPTGRLPQRKVFDVMRPGRAPASPTSKPVIAGPQVQDPAITVNGVGESRPVALAVNSERKIEVFAGGHLPPIEVPNDEVSPAAPGAVAAPMPTFEAASEDPTADETTSEESPGLTFGKPVTKPFGRSDSVTPTPPATSEGQEPAAHDDPLLNMPLDDPALDMNLDPSLAPPPEVAVAVPTMGAHAEAHKSSALKVIMLVAIVLLLALAIFDILLDAGFVMLKGVPHTNFFVQ